MKSLTKKCPTCDIVKNRNSFSTVFDKRDGKYYSGSYCKPCKQRYSKEHREYFRNHLREWKHKKGITKPMNENLDCSAFLGVYIAEQILSIYFTSYVKKMPYNSHGFDFICNYNMKIDAKSACINKYRRLWKFLIKKNQVADYFICIAFDHRKSLKPKHVWLIPSNTLNTNGTPINQLTGFCISESKLDFWKQYEQPIGKAIECCNSFKSVHL